MKDLKEESNSKSRKSKSRNSKSRKSNGTEGRHSGGSVLRVSRIVYAILLFAYAVFVLLDAFVIPRNIVRTEWGLGKLFEKGKAVVTDTSYEDDNISIHISVKRVKDTTVYIADVRLADASLLKTGLAGNAFGRNLAEVTSKIAKRNGAIFAVNGDYYGFRAKGYVLRNGYLYRSVANTRYPYGEDLVIWEDGSFEIIEEGGLSAQELADAGARQIFSFGPALVNHGDVQVIKGEEVERAQITNPRTAIGCAEPLHYYMVVSDGRTKESPGLSLYELAELMKDLGCETAYNLDGGGSSTIWFNGKVLNKPTTFGDVFEERIISDIVYIGY